RPRERGDRRVRRRDGRVARGVRGGRDRRRDLSGAAGDRLADVQPCRRAGLDRTARRDRCVLRREVVAGERLVRPRARARGARRRPRLRVDEVLARDRAAEGSQRPARGPGRRGGGRRLRTGDRRRLRLAGVDEAAGRERRRKAALVVLRRLRRRRPGRSRRRLRRRGHGVAGHGRDASGVSQPRRAERDPRRPNRSRPRPGLHHRGHRDGRARAGTAVGVVSQHPPRRLSRGGDPTELPGTMSRLSGLDSRRARYGWPMFRSVALAVVVASLLAAGAASAPARPPLLVGAVTPELLDASLATNTIGLLREANLGDVARVTVTWQRGQTSIDPGLLGDLNTGIAQARAAGVEVYLDVYPNGSSQTPRTASAQDDFAAWVASIVS